jgi:hypothetical protein
MVKRSLSPCNKESEGLCWWGVVPWITELTGHVYIVVPLSKEGVSLCVLG